VLTDRRTISIFAQSSSGRGETPGEAALRPGEQQRDYLLAFLVFFAVFFVALAVFLAAFFAFFAIRSS
jgi:hypothetical protein